MWQEKKKGECQISTVVNNLKFILILGSLEVFWIWKRIVLYFRKVNSDSCAASGLDEWCVGRLWGPSKLDGKNFTWLDRPWEPLTEFLNWKDMKKVIFFPLKLSWSWFINWIKVETVDWLAWIFPWKFPCWIIFFLSFFFWYMGGLYF